VKMVRHEIRVTGTVQGVGFRPFVFRLAGELGLAGSVRNTSAGVVIEVEGERARVEAFARRLTSEAPPLARIASVESREVEPTGEAGFRIIESEAAARPTALIPPDVALCADCAREIADPTDRRHAYPFTNCTNCGPRFTIVRGIPYDRSQTTMAAFAMCAECTREYGDPGSAVPRGAGGVSAVWAGGEVGGRRGRRRPEQSRVAAGGGEGARDQGAGRIPPGL